jgi:molecular chaperone DnaK (HSP70)
MEEVYGIDLGTTNSCIAIINSFGQAEVIQNKEGKLTTPSVVYFRQDGEIIVGNAAKNAMGAKPDKTVAFIKREMPNKEYHRTIGSENIDPVNISSLILKKLVDDANAKRVDEEGKAPVKKAVITVPAYFGEMERRRTEDAGKKMGLEVLKLLGEPVAAALSYSAKQLNNKTILVYDLGGGTFDVSIIRLQDKEMETLAVEGNPMLGGIDWDRILVDMALAKEGVNKKIAAIEQTPEGSLMLLAAETCKETLTESDSTYFSFFYEGMHNVEITREEFESYTEDLLKETDTLTQKVAKAAGLLNPDNTIRVDEILLVGGSSRMPMVSKMIRNKYKMEPKLVDPDLAVAKGAAIEARNKMDPNEKDRVTLKKDVGSRSYGLDTYVGDELKIYNLIFKNDDMVIRREYKNFTTREEGQESVAIAIYENESMDPRIDLSWGTLVKSDTITWGYPVSAGTPLNVIVTRDESGIIRVKAGCEGKEIEMKIGD